MAEIKINRKKTKAEALNGDANTIYLTTDGAIINNKKEYGNTFSGSYKDLTDKPTIPSAVSELTNDLGFITSTNAVDLTSDQEIGGLKTTTTILKHKETDGTTKEYALKSDIADNKVTQTNSSDNANYKVLLSNSDNSTEETATVKKNIYFTYNPANYTLTLGSTNSDHTESGLLIIGRWGRRKASLTGNDLTFDMSAEIGGYAGSFMQFIDAKNVKTPLMGFYGNANGIIYNFIGGAYNNPHAKLFTDRIELCNAGDATPLTTETYSLGTSSKKWKDLYIKNINGVAVGDSPKFTDTLYDDSELSGRVSTIEGKEAAWDAKSNFSGSYNDLTNKPTIPDALILSDWNQTDNTKKDFIKNKPSIPTKVSQLTNDSGYITDTDMSATYELKSAEISRGNLLITNGSGMMGRNYNFSLFVFDGSQSNGSGGAFTRTDIGAYTAPNLDEYIHINPSELLALSFDAISDKGLASMFGVLFMYDVDKYTITAGNIMYYQGTTTTLTLDLNPGDTIVHLESVENWAPRTLTYLRKFIVWNYKNSFGYLYPVETYSRNTYVDVFDNDESVFDRVNNTITLKKAWAGPSIPAGTSLSQGNDGNTYQYWGPIALIIPNTWTTYTGLFNGTDYSGLSRSNYFRPGTAYVRIGFLWDFNRALDLLWVTNINAYALRRAAESDPTVPNHVKSITQQDINNWNNKSLLPDIPSDGTYVLQATKSGNNITYQWILKD